MERRELLKSLAGLPFVRVLIGDKEVHAVEVAKAKYIIFIDVNQRCIEDFQVPEDHPLAYAPIVPLYLHDDQRIEDLVAIYKLDEEESSALFQPH